MILIYLSTAWMIGIYVASRLALPVALWGLITLLPLSVAWLWRRDPRVRLAALCGLFAILGAMRYTVVLPHFDEHSVSTYNDRGWGTLTGVVAAEPDVRDSYVNLRLQAQTLILEDGDSVDVEGLVLVRAPRYPERFYGDRLEVRGQLETPPVFEGFSYKDYLARQGIYSLVRWARITVLERGQGSPLFTLLLVFKRHAQSVIANVLPEPSAALLTGILLGVESGIPADLSADFSTTGTSHIIAISGFNISIIANAISSLSVGLVGRRYAAWFSTAAIALYTLFVGASAAVVRAAVMGSVAVWGKHFGRQNSAPNALLGTALLMTFWNPRILWDLGFLLSFAATLGLILFVDPFQSRFEGLLASLLPASWAELTGKFFKESLVLTTCAQLTTLPIILYNFRTLSLVTLLSNVLILPPQEQVMLWGAIATVGGLIWLPLGRVLGWVAWLFLAYTIWIVETTARIPHAAVSLGTVSPVLVWGWYAALGGGAWLMAQTEERQKAFWHTLGRALTDRLTTKMLVGSLAAVALLVWLAVAALPDGKLHVTVLDVGEGDAVFIETPTGQQVVVNGGPSPTKMTAHLGRRMPFWDRSLDLVVLTDPKDGHLAGLIPVLERYDVVNLLHVFPPEYASPTGTRWQALLQEKGVVAQQPIAGTQIDLGRGAILTVLHPTDEPLVGTRSDVNNHSIVLRVDYGQTCFLLTGSVEKEAEAAMLSRGENVRCDVLQVGRNGSQHATSPAFLRAVSPALAVISCGEGNRSGHPAEETLERLTEHGATIVRTDLHGSVEVISDGMGYDVKVGR